MITLALTILFAALAEPTLPAPVLISARQTENLKRADLVWSHPSAYSFEVRVQAKDFVRFDTHTFHGKQAKGEHTFEFQVDLAGETNSISVRVREDGQCSEWSNVIKVIPGAKEKTKARMHTPATP